MNIKINDTVIVPDPEGSDLHNHSFVGNVKEIKNQIAVVEDMEGNCFMVEVDRLKVEN